MSVDWNAAWLAVCLAPASAGVMAQDVTYRKDIKPLFDKQCPGPGAGR